MDDYRVMLLEGTLSETRAFLAGLAAGGGLAWDVHFCEECGIESESLKDRLLEKLGLQRDLTRVVVGRALAERIPQALERLPREARGALAVHSDDPVAAAALRFRCEIYHRKMAAEVRALLRDPPAGVAMEWDRDTEETHPSAEALEAYAPEHDYAWRASGTARGSVAGVLALRAKLRAYEPIELEPIRLTPGS